MAKTRVGTTRATRLMELQDGDPQGRKYKGADRAVLPDKPDYITTYQNDDWVAVSFEFWKTSNEIIVDHVKKAIGNIVGSKRFEVVLCPIGHWTQASVRIDKIK